MGFLDYFFSSKEKDTLPSIQFGRFSDSYKAPEKYAAWDRALELFEKGERMESFRSFLFYLKDESIANVQVVDEGNMLAFSFYQGSKKIEGTMDNRMVKAEAKIAIAEGFHIGMMRKLLEENYKLKYCRYALDKENSITITFSSYAASANPYKLYYSLKELAIHADKKDDILIDEFEELKHVNTGHTQPISEKEKQIKYAYMISEIQKTLDLVENTSIQLSHNPGAASYAYLDVLYRIDYLVKPEGHIMETIENIHNLFFQNTTNTPEKKNRVIRKELNNLLEMDREKFDKEIYTITSTFGVTQASGQSRIQDFIKSEIKNMDWYMQNKHLAFAEAIPSYIVGYSLFNYSLPTPLRDLFNFYYQVTQESFFDKLGIEGGFSKDTTLIKDKVRKQVKAILSKYKDDYPHMKANLNTLNCINKATFGKSFLLMISDINFLRKDNI